MKLARFLLGKSIRLLLLLLTVSVLSFILVKLSPIDPVNAYVGSDMNLIGPEQRERIAEKWGLNDPPMEQYLRWLDNLVHGDLGTSSIYKYSVGQVIRERFAASLWLMLAAWMISGVLGFILGVIAGARRGSWIDKAISVYSYTLASAPTFWLALVLLVVFSVWLGWTPIGGSKPFGVEDATLWQRLHHLILPAMALSVLGIANVTMHTRQKLIEVLESDYVLFARAQGESLFGTVWRHGLRNISLPAITLHFALLSELFGGAVLAETVFSYPGLGRATGEAGLRGDVPLLLAIVLFATIFVFVGNTIADLLYRQVDPRIRVGAA